MLVCIYEYNGIVPFSTPALSLTICHEEVTFH